VALSVNAVKISSIKFFNFKALKAYSISLQKMNILVGPNNSGKSTIVSAFRILDVALRKARSKKAEKVPIPSGSFGFGFRVPEENISVSLENVATDYNEEDSKIEFRLTNNNKLILFFPNDGGCILTWETPDKSVSSPSKFNQEFPVSIQVVPVLGPLEHNEVRVTIETVKSALSTHRASRHFRNYWRYFPEGWDEFASLVSKTWPGMQLNPPEDISVADDKLAMFCSEDRIAREIYWAGFGFQVWCQLLTHLFRAREATIVVIDEPEIYLHPDVQRQLLGILRGLDADLLLATHSVEIMGEADPSEILLIDKKKSSAQRLRDIEGIQQALETLGSAQNITLTQLARTRKLLFVEGINDYKLIRRFARRLGYEGLSSGNDLTPFESGGFSSWEKVTALSWGLSKTLEADIPIAAIYDRDYFCKEEIVQRYEKLNSEVNLAHIHERKEIENYLLVPSVLERVLDKVIKEREQRSQSIINKTESVQDILQRVSEKEKINIQGQYIARKNDFLKKAGKDTATITSETINWFEQKWKQLDERMEIVPGKKILGMLREEVQKLYCVNLTDIRIIDEYKREEVPRDLVALIENLESFRVLNTPDAKCTGHITKPSVIKAT
jgi:energy-coupling factor transporter ATP-binding protein EcfA2